MVKLLVTPKECAESLGLSIHTVRRAIRDGLIPGVRPLGRRSVRVRVTDVERLVQSGASAS